MDRAARPSPASAIGIRASSRRWRARRRSWLMPIPASSRRSRPRHWRRIWSATSRAGSLSPISSVAGRKRSSPASSWRDNISSSVASRSDRTSSPAARAIMAIRWARSPPAATPGAANPMRRCCRPPSATSRQPSPITKSAITNRKRSSWRGSPPNWRPNSSGSAPTRWRRSWPSRWSAPPSGCVAAAGGIFPRRARHLRPPWRAC